MPDKPDNHLLEACELAKITQKENIRFIRGKVDVIVELVAKREYLDKKSGSNCCNDLDLDLDSTLDLFDDVKSNSINN